MTEKELHKLRRQDLLKLLLAQAKEFEQVRQRQEETEETLRQTEGTLERLKARLDEKDAQLAKLKGRLDKKDMQIQEYRDFMEKSRSSRRIELEHAGSIAEAALKLNGVFEAAQKAADQYLYNIQLLCEAPEPDLDSDGEASCEAEEETETAGGDTDGRSGTEYEDTGSHDRTA